MTGFEDLLPAEMAQRKRGSSPMRAASSSPPRPGAPQAVAAAAPQAAPCDADCRRAASVDGLPDTTVDAWFALADADADGRVADSEARDFFLTSGLAPADLSKIWKLVKSPEVVAREGKGLSRHRFAQVLRLVALAQCGRWEFSQENATAALHAESWLALRGEPLPPPRLGAAETQAPAQQQQAQPATAQQQVEQQAEQQQPEQQQAQAAVGADAAFSGGGLLRGGSALGSVPEAAAASFEHDDDDLFGLRALQQRAASHGATSISAADGAGAAPAAVGGEGGGGGGMMRRLSRSMGVSQRDSRRGGLVRVQTGELEPPVAFVARLPPLQPKASAKLALLAAANGSLFAGPAVNGGLLQWGRPEGNLRRPLDVEGQGEAQRGKLHRLMSDMMYTHSDAQRVASEDGDAAPAIEVAATDKGRPAACMLADEAHGLLWVADREGWVYAYDVGGEPCLSLRCQHRAYHFQAQRVGHVTAMARTARGDLWTASSRGNIRVWELGPPALLGDAPEPPRCRELRKSFGERAHAGPVLALACPSDGQVVWSASTKGVLLWDAACGAFLGVLHRPLGGRAAALQPSASDVGGDRDSPERRYRIDGSRGLEVDPVTGYLLSRPPSADWARIAADQESWAAQTDNNINELMERVSIGGSAVVKGAGRAVKLLGKLARGLGGGGGGGSAAAGGGSGSSGSGAAAGEGPAPPNAAVAARASSYGALAASASMQLPSPIDDDVLERGDGSGAHPALGSIVALLAPPGGAVWVAHKGGAVDRYTGAGRRLGSEEAGASVTAAACVGQRVWIGFSDGMISVRDADGACLKVFQAHSAAVLSIVQTGARTYSLAADGCLKGWSSAVPHPADIDALVSWDEQAVQTFRRESLRALCVTWNVGESKPEPGSPFFRWVHETAFSCQLAVIGLQEIEMGSSSVALAAAKDAFSARAQERGNTNAKFWGAGVLAALGGERHWHQVGLRQLSGMLILVFARNHLREHIGEVTTASVACGVLGVGGNKGAVAVEFSVHRRKVAVVCSHFAAHQASQGGGAVEARNANYSTICRQLTFIQRPWFEDESPAAAAAATAASGGLPPSLSAPRGKLGVPADQLEDDSDADSVAAAALDAAGSSALATLPPAASALPEELVVGEGMRGAQMLVWLGDFNYRIDGGYEAVKERAIRAELAPLLDLDQCRREMAAGRVFRGLREGPITFRPTYKFDKASANPFAYDTSEKRRIPAWCDRVFFRGSQPFATPEPEEGEEEAARPSHEEDDVAVRALEYSCWADVCDSDHKPVYAVLEANLPITDQAAKRRACSALLKECAEAAGAGAGVPPPAVSLQPDHVKLHQEAMPRQMVLLRNDGQQPLLFCVTPEPPPPGGASPADAAAAATAAQLLEVRPARGVVAPGQDVQLQVHISGDEWALRGAQHNPRLTFRVRLCGEYGGGGEADGPGAAQLAFTAECLAHI